MSISKDNELDNYGVWVKHSANSEENMDLKTDDLTSILSIHSILSILRKGGAFFSRGF